MNLECLYLMMNEAQKDLPEQSLLSLALDPEFRMLRFEIITLFKEKRFRVQSQLLDVLDWSCVPILQKSVDTMRNKCGLKAANNTIYKPYQYA